jgi:hypothetical protein
MGGTAILIHGDIEPKRHEQPRGFLSRLFGRREERKELPGEMIELPSKDLKVLAEDFALFLKARMPNPSASSRAVLDYLDVVGANVYLRGEKNPDGRGNWYVQLNFGSCAGMAEISAEVAAHWAMLWYASERQRIDSEVLQPAGFTAVSVELIAEPAAFLPVGSGGYASYQADSDYPEERRYFSMDAAAAESDETEADRIHCWLESHGAAMVRESGCHCQLCAPGFDPASIPGFSAS